MMKLGVGHGVVLGLLIRETLTFILSTFKASIMDWIMNSLVHESCLIPRMVRKLRLTLKRAWTWLRGGSPSSSTSTSTISAPSKLPEPLTKSPPPESVSSLKPSAKLDADEQNPLSG